MKKLLTYLEIGKVGGLELLFSLYMILVAYQYGSVPLSLLTLLIMDVIALCRPYSDYKIWKSICKPMAWCMAFVVVHEFILYLMIGMGHSHMMNANIALIINVVSIFIIAPKLDFEKLIHSLMIVAIISAIGLVVQFVKILAGAHVSPILLPFLPNPGEQGRFDAIIRRPTSFFVEPAAFTTFMMVPYFYVVYKKHYLLAAGMIFIMLLSGSTTAIGLTFILLAVYACTQIIKLKYRVLVVLIGAIVMIVMFTSSLFEVGVNKMYNTEVETSIRLYNGVEIFLNTKPENLLFGVPYANLTDYCIKERIPVIIYLKGVYCTTFWSVLVKYGIFSLILYLYGYWRMMKDCRDVIPYVVCLLVALFTQSIRYDSGTLVFQLCSIYALMIYTSKHKRRECRCLTSA